MNLMAKAKHTLMQILLVSISLSLFAFIDSDFFRNGYDFNQLVSRFETLAPNTQHLDQFGIEVEGYYSEKSLTGVSNVSNDYVELRGFNHDHGFDIRFSDDLSIKHPAGKRSVEVVSPILSDPQDADKFYDYLKIISEKSNFQSEPIYSGTHFHFDFRNPTPEEIALLTIILEKIRPEIESAFSISPNRSSQWAKGYSEKDFKNLLKFLNDSPNLLDTQLNLKVDRDKSSNWKALGKHQTFEYRGFNSTNDINLLKIQHDLIGKIVRAVRQRDPRLITLLKSEGIHGLTLKKIATSLDCLIASDESLKYVHNQTKYEILNSRKIERHLKTAAEHLVQYLDLRSPITSGMYSAFGINGFRINNSNQPLPINSINYPYRFSESFEPRPHIDCRQFYTR